jgi:hypothetical protein
MIADSRAASPNLRSEIFPASLMGSDPESRSIS